MPTVRSRETVFWKRFGSFYRKVGGLFKIDFLEEGLGDIRHNLTRIAAVGAVPAIAIIISGTPV